MGSLEKAVRYLVMDPYEKGNVGLVPLRLSQLMHERTGGVSDLHLRRVLKMLKPKVPLRASALMDDAAIATAVAALEKRGWDIMPWRLSADDIASMRQFAFSTPAYATSPDQRISITENNIPHDHGRYQWRMSDLVGHPVIQRLLADGAMHTIAQNYLGCRPILTAIGLWLDPVYDGYYGAHVYHYDNDGPAFLKFFIYLTDVDVDTGAHAYIQGSQSRHKPPQFRLSQRYERETLVDHYGAENEIVFAAPAGTVLAEDTAGFHKGTTLKKGYRMLIELQYAMLDIPHLEEFGHRIDRARLDNLDPGIKMIARKLFA